MPTLVPEFLATNRREKKGFWSDDRVPRAWMSALTFYSTADSVERADSDKLPRFPDFQIPDSGEATPVFSVAAWSARLQGPLAEAGDELDPILRRLEGTAVVEMKHELCAMLQGIQIAAHCAESGGAEAQQESVLTFFFSALQLVAVLKDSGNFNRSLFDLLKKS